MGGHGKERVLKHANYANVTFKRNARLKYQTEE